MKYTDFIVKFEDDKYPQECRFQSKEPATVEEAIEVARLNAPIGCTGIIVTPVK